MTASISVVNDSRCARLGVAVVLLVLMAGCERNQTQPPPCDPDPVRISMADLHINGGVPPGWRFRVPRGDIDAGRAAFFENECYTCHKVAGEPFPEDRQEGDVGPELTGMGAHHPPEYFAESILNPNAVVVEGPGYVSPTGTSIMPSYDGMSLQELTNLVAYIGSLKAGGDHAEHAQMNHAIGTSIPGAPSAAAYFAQAFTVPDDRLEAFYDWFEKGQARRVVGLSSIDTYAGRLHDGKHEMLCVFGFDGEASLLMFLAQRDAKASGADDFLHPVSEYSLRSEGLYRAVQMSWP